MRNKFVVKLLLSASAFIVSTATAAPFTVTISPATLYQGIANNVAFRITNHQSVPIAIGGLRITGPSGFTFLPGNGAACQKTLSPGESCTTGATIYTPTQPNTIWHIAIQTRYGSIKYRLTKPAIVEDQKTTVAINPNSNDKPVDVIIDSNKPTGTFLVKNTGSKPWVNAKVTIDAADNAWLTLPSSTCVGTIPPGATCAVSYSAKSPFGNAASVISATGDTIAVTTQDLEVNNTFSIGTEADTPFIHLGYRAVKLINLSDKPQALSNVTTSISTVLKGKIDLCNAIGSNCNTKFSSDCLLPNKTLNKGESCHLWFKAMPNSKPIVTIAGEVTSSVTVAGKNLSRTFAVAYGDMLYLGSKDYRLPPNPTGPIPISPENTVLGFNGLDWTAPGSAMNKSVYTLTVLNGDLYAGGNFTTAGGTAAKSLARWNGTNWSSVGDGVNGGVYALTALKGDLYAGGNFTTAGGTAAKSVARWNGTNWSPLGAGLSGVLAFGSLNNDLYASGYFSTRIARWNGASWLMMGPGFNSTNAYAFTTLKGDLYAGGTFTFTTAAGLAANHIARWDGTNWSSLAEGLTSSVYALTTIGDEIYAANESYGSPYNVSSWNGNRWTNLPNLPGLKIGELTTLVHAPHLTMIAK